MPKAGLSESRPVTGGPITVVAPLSGADAGDLLAVDSRRGLVYAGGPHVDLIVYDERSNTAKTVGLAPGYPRSHIAVDQGTGFVYVGRSDGTQLTVLRAGEPVGWVTLPGSGDLDVVVDPVHHLAYVRGDNDRLSVLRGTRLLATVPVGAAAHGGLVVNPRNGLVYVPNSIDASVSVVEARRVVATVKTRGRPDEAAVDPLSGLVYVTNSDNTVTVLQGTRRDPVATLPVGASSSAVAVNPRTHLVYVTSHEDQTVTIIRGTRVIRTLPVPVADFDQTVAVNPATGLVLVAGGEARSPDAGAITGLRGTKVVYASPPVANTVRPVFDTRTGRAFVSAEHGVLGLQTPTVSTVTVRRPQRGRSYHRGAHAPARYRCTAGVNNVLRTCHADVANGGLLDTTRVGRHTFTVAATSAYGSTVRRTVHYRVIR